MPSFVAFALALPALQVATASRGHRGLQVNTGSRGFLSGSRRFVDVWAVDHNASEQQPRNPDGALTSDFFTMDAEAMDEVPNVEDAPVDAHTCHPKCWWECGLPSCNTACKPTCKAPQCVTTCDKMSMVGCQRTCTQPQCAVVCPGVECKKGNCPECKTVCNKPKCSLACGRTCHSKCADPVCSWHCEVGPVCPKPACKMKCEQPSCTSFKGKDHTLHDVYQGFGDPTQEMSAVYGASEVADTYLARVPWRHLQGLAGRPMEGPYAAGPPLPMEGPLPMAGPTAATPADMKPWKAGATPKAPCKEQTPHINHDIRYVKYLGHEADSAPGGRNIVHGE